MMIKDFAKKHTNLLISLFVNTFFFLLIVSIRGTNYELSDDWFFSANIANGHYDYTFCSYFIQVLSGVIQKFIYPINAFMLLQVVLGFVAMTTIGYIFLDTFDLKKGMLFILIIEGLFAVNIYSLVTFTKTAAILMTAGGLIMLWAYHNKKHLGYWIFGIVLVVLGSFYRFKIFYSVLAIFFFFICGLLISKLEKFNIKSILLLAKDVLSIKTVSIVLAMIILVFSFNFISREIIYSDESMGFYEEYNSLRSSVVDYAVPNFEDEGVEEKFAEIGVSENDFQMMRLWYIDAQGSADVDTLKKFRELQETEGRPWYKAILVMLYLEFMALVKFSSEGILILSFLILAAVVLIVYNKKSTLPVGALTLGIGALYSYLWISGRCNYRAVFSLWFAAIICLLYSIQFLQPKEKSEEKSLRFDVITKVFAVAFSLVFLLLSMNITIPKLTQKMDEDYPRLEEYINSSKNKTFALSRYAYLYVRNATKMDNIFILQENEAFDKCVYFGTPYYGHPRYNELLANKGIENLYTDIIDSDDIYFVDLETLYGTRTIEMFTTYLNEQYGDNKTYRYELVDTVLEPTAAEKTQFNIYKIVTVD